MPVPMRTGWKAHSLNGVNPRMGHEPVVPNKEIKELFATLWRRYALSHTTSGVWRIAQFNPVAPMNAQLVLHGTSTSEGSSGIYRSAAGAFEQFQTPFDWNLMATIYNHCRVKQAKVTFKLENVLQSDPAKKIWVWAKVVYPYEYDISPTTVGGGNPIGLSIAVAATQAASILDNTPGIRKYTLGSDSANGGSNTAFIDATIDVEDMAEIALQNGVAEDHDLIAGFPTSRTIAVAQHEHHPMLCIWAMEDDYTAIGSSSLAIEAKAVYRIEFEGNLLTDTLDFDDPTA